MTVVNKMFGDATSRIYVGDAVVGLKSQPSWRTDLLFADPPFNIGHAYGGDSSADKKEAAEFAEFNRRWMIECVRVLRPGGSLFFHLPDSMVARASILLENMKMTRVNWIIFVQDFGQYRESNFIPVKHHLLYYVKPGGERTWNVKEVLEPSRRLQGGDSRVETAKFKGWKPFDDVWFGENLGRVQGNNKERHNPKLHPNQLPELYMARIIRAASNVGDSIYDPFVGSGTTPCVARALKRRFTGTELIEASAKSAWARVKKGPVRDVAGPLFTMRAANAAGVTVAVPKEYK